MPAPLIFRHLPLIFHLKHPKNTVFSFIPLLTAFHIISLPAYYTLEARQASINKSRKDVYYMAYPKVHIVNSTNFSVKGKVEICILPFSSDDNYADRLPSGSWTAGSRGVCLLTEVSAAVHTPGQDSKATPYESSGTSYSQFAVLQTASRKIHHDPYCDLSQMPARPTPCRPPIICCKYKDDFVLFLLPSITITVISGSQIFSPALSAS